MPIERKPGEDVDDRIAQAIVGEAWGSAAPIPTITVAIAKRLRNLRARLAEIEEMAVDKHDVEDRGDSGTVGPNDWMRVSQIIHEALCELEGKAPW
jgi:hypothetical protein